MEQAIFRGTVNDNGRFVPFDLVRFQGWFREHKGTKVEVVVREPQPQRSLDQNAYLHAQPFRLIAEHTGADIADVKLALMGHCWGWTYSALAGREVPVKAHTSEMTTKECDYFIDWLVPWALDHLDLFIPLPNEGSDASAP